MAGFVFNFSLLVTCNMFSLTRDTRIQSWNLHAGISLTFPYSSVMQVSSAMGLCCQFAEINLLPYSQLQLFGDFHGIPLVNNSTKCKTVPQLKAFYHDKRSPVWTTYPHVCPLRHTSGQPPVLRNSIHQALPTEHSRKKWLKSRLESPPIPTLEISIGESSGPQKLLLSSG